MNEITHIEYIPNEGDIRLSSFDGVVGLSDVAMGENNDLIRDQTFETSIKISLFTNRRAQVDDVLSDNTDDKCGYWGDVVSEEVNDSMGSRLWLLGRNKMTTELLPATVEYTKEALQWMIEDSIASEINVTAEKYDSETVIINIEICKPNDTNSVIYKYFYNWKAQSFRI